MGGYPFALEFVIEGVLGKYTASSGRFETGIMAGNAPVKRALTVRNLQDCATQEPRISIPAPHLKEPP